MQKKVEMKIIMKIIMMNKFEFWFISKNYNFNNNYNIYIKL